MLRTPLYQTHARLGGKMVEFGGWEMPITFGSILAEAKAVRESVGIFDVSHMGRLKVAGKEDIARFDSCLTVSLQRMSIGQVRYGLICNYQGGVVDDLTVCRMQEKQYLAVVNAVRREVDINWLYEQGRVGEVADLTADTAMIAVQGPKSVTLMDELFTGQSPSRLKWFHGQGFMWEGESVFISRTGYTGEDGFEIICPAGMASSLWETLRGKGGMPCGLGSRDILRLEAGLCLYGHELTEEITPVEADLMRFVDLTQPDFIGKAAIQKRVEARPSHKRVGLVLSTRSTARQKARVLVDGEEIGWVSSGVFSPTLNTAIAMAYVRRDLAEEGREVLVEIRYVQHPARIVKLPFYRRAETA